MSDIAPDSLDARHARGLDPDAPNLGILAAPGTSGFVTQKRWPSWVEEAADRLGTGPWQVVGSFIGVFVVAGGGWLLMRNDPGPLPELTIPLVTVVSTPLGTAPEQQSVPIRTRIIVHAAGAIRRPGVYDLDEGARVADLVALAGGLATEADQARLNLAAALADGQRLYVPVRDEVVPPPIQPDGATPAGSSTEAAVSINQADAAELTQLPGVGPAIAAAIVVHRTTHGPFTSVDELVAVPGIGEAKLAVLRDRATL